MNDINAAGCQKLLAKLGACSKARHAAKGKSLREVWNSCERGDWLLWLSAKLGIDRKLIVIAACDCARKSLRFVPAGETRPREAIETAEAWCRGEATINQVRDAAHAAYAAAGAAYAAADAAYAAYAAYAADAAGAAGAAAHAAAHAADAAAYAADAAAYAAAQKQCAGLVRTRIPFDVILTAANAAGAEMSEQETTQFDSYESDQAFAQAYYLVMGKSPPFGRDFHYRHALEDIKNTVNLLKQAIRDFERERNAKVTP